MLSAPTHLQCPACCHVFMSVQSRSDGNETCPHCAFVGPRAHYQTLAQSFAAEPVRFQKRMPRPHEPLLPEPPMNSPDVPHEPHAYHAFHPTHQPRMSAAAWPGMGAPWPGGPIEGTWLLPGARIAGVGPPRPGPPIGGGGGAPGRRAAAGPPGGIVPGDDIPAGPGMLPI